MCIYVLTIARFSSQEDARHDVGMCKCKASFAARLAYCTVHVCIDMCAGLSFLFFQHTL